MSLQLDDTIVALASAPGVGGRGIVRVSGADVKIIASKHFEAADVIRWKNAARAERHPGMWRLDVDVPWDDPPFREGVRLPVDVALWPTNRSYTGQALAELHLVSSPPLLEAIVAQFCRSGCRPAQPGEFTLRAFLAGRLDLMQAEAVLGVIDAADHAELELALRQLAGGISHDIVSLRSDLLDLLAELEAGLDFVDEDIEFVSREQLLARMTFARKTVSDLCDQAARRLTSSTRPRVVLAGLPNAGKSTLLNALTDRSAALVSEVSGTTRDYLLVPLDRDGLHVDLIDTAGWDESTTGIEALAQQMRTEQWQHADLIVWCSDLSADASTLARDEPLWSELAREQRRHLRIGTKADTLTQSASQGERSPRRRILESVVRSPSLALRVSVSSTSKSSGLTELCRLIAETLSTESHGQRQWLGMTAIRCQESLASARDAISRCVEAVALGVPDDLLIVDLRESLDHLGHIVGAVYTDDILDRIFSKFCIGK